jgi:DNA-binding NtrC family response regulator
VLEPEVEVELSGGRILLVDDQPANLEVLCELLEAEGYEISLAPRGEIALSIVSQAEGRPDLILLDVMMPEMDGYEVCRRLKADPDTRAIPVIFITARDLTEGVLEGLDAGGVDYIAKPFRDQEVLARVQTHLRLSLMARELAARNRELEREIAQRRKLKGQLSLISRREAERWGLEEFVGQSPTMRKILADIRLLQENVGTSVLITGESGTGKELIARAIHFGSACAEGPFVPVNCVAIPHELVESALFGHVKGAFTGADADRQGYFELAHEGTLFLDEIGDMPLDLQGKLLRVLEDGQVWPVGAGEGKKVETRVLAATNTDLTERIRTGSFRQDLYFRLARFTVTAPPLRERQQDIPLLVRHFVRHFAEEMGRDPPAIAAEGLQRLSAYAFPGNVRELKNTIERALIESRGSEIGPEHLHFQPEAGVVPTPATVQVSEGEIPLNLEEAELWLIKRAIGKAGGNVSKAARLLGINRTRIYRALRQEEEGG